MGDGIRVYNGWRARVVVDTASGFQTTVATITGIELGDGAVRFTLDAPIPKGMVGKATHFVMEGPRGRGVVYDLPLGTPIHVSGGDKIEFQWNADITKVTP